MPASKASQVFAAITLTMSAAGSSFAATPIKLVCPATASIAGDARAVVLNEMAAAGIKAGAGDWAWLTSMMDQGGLPTSPIGKLSQMAKASFEAEAALLKRGNVISALMIHDGAKAIPDYASSRNSASIHRFMVISVQPTSHPGTDPHDHGNDDGDAGINQKMATISKRLGAVKAGLGPFYSDTAAKYFIRAHAYEDPIGVQASSKLLCSDGLTSTQLSAIVKAANYVKHGTPLKASAPATRK